MKRPDAGRQCDTQDADAGGGRGAEKPRNFFFVASRFMEGVPLPAKAKTMAQLAPITACRSPDANSACATVPQSGGQQNRRMPLNFFAFSAAIWALKRALHATTPDEQWASLSAEVQEAVKAGVIQNFVVAYEQSWKMMRRWLEANPLASDVSGASLRQVFRLAAKAGLIGDVDLWMQFHAVRNQTSHTYNLKVA